MVVPHLQVAVRELESACLLHWSQLKVRRGATLWSSLSRRLGSSCNLHGEFEIDPSHLVAPLRNGPLRTLDGAV